jgi:hypothetical protein
MATKVQIDDLTDDQLLWVLANKCWLEHSIIQEIRSHISEQLDSDEVEVPDELLQGVQA